MPHPLNPRGYPTHNPDDVIPVEQRASLMFGVHPSALDEMGTGSREDLYLAHLRAAIRDALAAGEIQ